MQGIEQERTAYLDVIHTELLLSLGLVHNGVAGVEVGEAVVHRGHSDRGEKLELVISRLDG